MGRKRLIYVEFAGYVASIGRRRDDWYCRTDPDCVK